jgi:MurNAc alpha-1-phosphate uridylyltransferase
VLKALPHLGPGPFIVHNSDTVWSERARPNLPMLTNTWLPAQMEALLLLAHRDSSIGYTGRGDFHIDGVGRLMRRTPGEEAPYVFAGVSVIEPRLFDGIAEQAFSLNVIFDRAAAKNALFGVVLDGTWMHVGTPQALSEAEIHLHEGQRRRA